MRVRIKHDTRYHYPSPAALGPHIVRLRPAEHGRAEMLSYNLDIAPQCEVRWQHDPWSNRIARCTFADDQRIDELRVTVDAAFDIRPVNPFDFFVDDRCEKVPFAYPDGLADELAPFLYTAPPSAQLAAFVEETPFAGFTVDYLVALNRRVAERVSYIIRGEPGIQTSDETLARGRGSCRDSALLLCDVLRARGLAARFVSGYLIQLADEGIIPDEAKGVARDVVDLHAWAEVYVPGAGWIGVDGTSGLLCGEGHVPLAATVSPELAAPITGTASVPAARFDFSMDVARLGHEPRPRKPYDDDAWARLCATGNAVDGVLREHGLTLTCGGEPTWTSRLHPREPEWNTEAVGATKWTQGLRLAGELSTRLGHGTLPMRRAGKLYPGESLPRWALHLLWRADGVPIWRDRALLAPTDDSAPADAASAEQAHALGVGIAERLDVTPAFVPAYEDPWHFVREEQDLPADVDPLHVALDDDEERRRLARVLERGLGRPVGYALPIQCWNARWSTGRWIFRREHLFLVPGDSPMGLRLPLDRIAGTSMDVPEVDTSAVRAPIAFDPRRPREQRDTAGVPQRRRDTARPRTASQLTVEQVFGTTAVMRTALCVEPRDGVLHAFLPPLPDAESFLELVAAIEDSAAELGLPVRVEGYGPPSDPRLRSCVVTPDPGVIEVNLPVAHSFGEYLALMGTLGDAANHAGLCTEKYQLDGRDTGSGGGNHITLGGPTPDQSPFLVRPQLLASLLRYLQNHPSLSYLFSGLFVGPTSQAPRVDEARLDALVELELALSQVPAPGAPVLPWTIDRLLRDLLVDVSGNTHRTEVCIDKLYAPEGPAGRLGIVELRAFEMPPNERMAAAQMLLVRAMIAGFCREPYDAPLARWGTSLHDRFMLPYFLGRDIADVAADLTRVGIEVDAAWFMPFLDYRFPVFGTLRVDGVELELRSALEPWPTLGEQPVGPVVSRYVDSSLERLQVRVRGLTPERHVVTVNGYELPLTPTEREAEGIAGVRFRAWQPPFCLQPNIGVHHPLRFDVIDTWAKRSLGACTYHVWHPEGRAFDEPPLTAFEAAARRAQRFTTEGHAPYPATPRPPVTRPEHPLTLDLRWQR